MRNGTIFNGNKLVLVNSNGRPVSGLDLVDDAAVDYLSSSDAETPPVGNLQEMQMTLIVFITVSVACAAAAIATGSYAVWLSRQQAARQALTDVNDILKSCQSRMQQLEADVKRLPERQS